MSGIKMILQKDTFRSLFLLESMEFCSLGRCHDWECQTTILLVTPKGREKETITRLSRVGFDQTLGYLNHGIEAWSKAGNAIDTIDGIEVTD